VEITGNVSPAQIKKQLEIPDSFVARYLRPTTIAFALVHLAAIGGVIMVGW